SCMAMTQKLHAWIARQWQHRGIWAYTTWPLARIYQYFANKARDAYRTGSKAPYRAPVPVVVVGNIYVGGTGKTPVTCGLAQILQELGYTPGLVSRGYGRRQTTLPATGQGLHLDWQTYGDEPALIALRTGMPVSAHANRALAAKHLLQQYPEVDIILSDDGLQHHGLTRDFEILVQDERGVGNGWVLPAGPLREPPSRLSEVDLVVQRCEHLNKVTTDTNAETSAETAEQRAAPITLAFSVALTHWQHAASGQIVAAHELKPSLTLKAPVVAVAAIGVPVRFFQSISELGIDLDARFALADHKPISQDWLEQQTAGTILMTEKDAVKLPSIHDQRIWVAQTTTLWGSDDMAVFLKKQLTKSGINRLG
ncbi:MAG TPA: tetraacyldisaccharide 4'-kinase, partial [Orrella sp.]